VVGAGIHGLSETDMRVVGKWWVSDIFGHNIFCTWATRDVPIEESYSLHQYVVRAYGKVEGFKRFLRNSVALIVV
jgi:hypothetical protein